MLKYFIKNIEYKDAILANKNLIKIQAMQCCHIAKHIKWQDKLNIKVSDFENISKIECKNSFGGAEYNFIYIKV